MAKRKTLYIAWLLVLLAAPILGVQAQDPGGEPQPINGVAHWATPPTGPDFDGVTLVPFRASNPAWSAWEATLAQNQRYLDPAALQENIQVSHSGWVPGASHFVNDFSEVMVYLDPTDPNHLLGASKFFFDPS